MGGGQFESLCGHSVASHHFKCNHHAYILTSQQIRGHQSISLTPTHTPDRDHHVKVTAEIVELEKKL